MTETRTIEVFSAGCPLCRDTIREIRAEACGDCEVEVIDLDEPEGSRRARELGVESVPAVAIDGDLAGCCQGSGPDLEVLRDAGIGRPAG